MKTMRDKPTSATGWWIVTYTIALVGPSEDLPREAPKQVHRKQVMVRCEHWREAFTKARRIGIDEERAESELGRWQYIGINDLIPLPEKNEEGLVLATLDLASKANSLENLFLGCVEDYAFEASFDEQRSGEFYRAISNSKDAGF